MIQNVKGPTHEHGPTLDLVLSHSFNADKVDVVDSVFSDHKSCSFKHYFP